MVKNLPAMWETWVQSLGQEDPLEKGMATCFNIFAWGEFHGQRDLGGYTVHRVTKESDTTERLTLWSFAPAVSCLEASSLQLHLT